jgi:hypothetical protein
MMSRLEKILDDCLTDLMSGEATIEDYLAKYPEHADELRRLIVTAGKLEHGRDIRPSPQFRNRARTQLTAHMNSHPRSRPAGWQRGVSFLRFSFAFGRTLNMALGLAAVLMLFLTTGTVLAQNALPGDTLYGWKLTSEEMLRKIHPDSLAVDLMVARRRVNDLIQVAGDLQAEMVALEGYQQSLVRLSHYSAPEAQATISQSLVEQKVELDQAHVMVPELEQLLTTFDEINPLLAGTIPQTYLELDYETVAVEAGRITYSLTITNRGPGGPVNATLVNLLSPQEELVSVADEDSCDLGDDGSLTCLVSDLSTDTARQLTLTTAVDRCYSGVVANTVMVANAGDKMVINPDSRLVIENNITQSFPTSARVVYVQSDQQSHSLGLATSTADLINGTFHIRAAAPAWSPDGSRLAFFGVQGISELAGIYTQGNGVWVVDVVGVQSRNPRQLMAQDHIKNIAWSPDGAMLAVEIGIPTLPHEIVVIEARDGQEISRFPGEQPAWSPDSQMLVIKRCSQDCGLWQVDLEGNPERQLTFYGTDSYPAWSPDGQHLVFSSQERHGNWEIYKLRFEDNEISRLTNRSGSDTTPVFGPCGQEIYIRTDHYGSWWITAMKLDGSDEYKIREGVGPTNDWGLARPAVY